jgi:hypothetical protein
MIATALAALLFAAPAGAAIEPIDCPKGMHRISTDNPYEPFRCVRAEDENKKGFDAVVGPKGFKERPHCPHGTPHRTPSWRPFAATTTPLPSRTRRPSRTP